jgi:hypothetical protein
LGWHGLRGRLLLGLLWGRRLLGWLLRNLGLLVLVLVRRLLVLLLVLDRRRLVVFLVLGLLLHCVVWFLRLFRVQRLFFVALALDYLNL